jgi:hypothetical protein
MEPLVQFWVTSCDNHGGRSDIRARFMQVHPDFAPLILPFIHIYLGHAVAYLVEALCYKTEGRGFNFKLDHWVFQLI